MWRWFVIGGVCALMLGPLGNADAQVGAGVRYQNLSDGYWHDVFASAGGHYRDQRTMLYATYWFRLKEKRMEFLPEVGYFTTFGEIDSEAGNRSSGWYVQLNMDLYLLDFGSDCNCPTFSKQNDFFKRGFFIEISPGYEMRSIEVTRTVTDTSQYPVRTTRKFNNNGFKIAGSLGLDIGISDLLTITPLVGLSFHSGTEWSGLTNFLDADVAADDDRHVDSDLALNAGLRLLFRPDYIRGRR